MNKRKRTTASKAAHNPKIAAKAQRASHATVKSPSNGITPRKRRDDSSQEALLETLATPFEARSNQTVEGAKKTATNFSLALASVPAYQSKLLEMAQANMQLAFEFTQRLATIKSPIEFPAVIAEFTSRRMAMFQKHSTEMAGLSI